MVGLFVSLLGGQATAMLAGGRLSLAAMLVAGCLVAACGLGLRQLRPWARVVATLCSLVGLLGFPWATLLSAYFLFLLLSRKGSTVFSADYQTVIAHTPEMEGRTPRMVITLGLLVLILYLVASIPFYG